MLPDFLCIGAFKAGTTWIYQNLQYHPDVEMPPYKEIYYFHTPPLSKLPLITHIFADSPYERRRLRLILTHYLPREKKRIRWFMRYLLLPPTDRWYESLFPRAPGQIAGDITPAYARLWRGAIGRAYALLPDARIIYCLRNPIRRTWSQVAMYFANWRDGLDRASDEEIEDLLERKVGSRDSNYVLTLEFWEEFYPSDQIHVVFFDELAQRPRTFLRGLYQSLELDTSDRFIPETVDQRINPRQYPPIPDRFARYLACQYYEQMEALHHRVHSAYTADWLEFAEQYL